MEIFVKGCYRFKLIRNAQCESKIQWIFLTQIPGKTPYQTCDISRNGNFSPLSLPNTHKFPLSK